MERPTGQGADVSGLQSGRPGGPWSWKKSLLQVRLGMTAVPADTLLAASWETLS